MSFDISEFQSALQQDGARPNLFNVFLTIPGVVDVGGASNKFRFMCKASVIPGSDLGLIPAYYFGREVKLAGNRVFADWTVDILNDEDFSIRRALELWSTKINSHQGNLRDPAFINTLGYGTSATVQHYGKANNLLRVYRIVGLFPTNIAPINLDWGANDTLEEYNVTFQYQYWEAGSNPNGDNEVF